MGLFDFLFEESKLQEKFNYLTDKAYNETIKDDDISQLDDNEKVFFVLYIFNLEIQNGGLCQFFVNSSRAYATLISQYLEIIGALEHKMLYDDFVKENIDLDYDKFHQLLIIDYLNCFNIKPASWWSERISPKEKNEFLRECFENGTLTEDLNTLYKYSLVIPLKESTIVVIYKNNTKNIYII